MGQGVERARLSVCIPTFNFGAFIGATLDSITAQLSPDVEIVVLDGGSTDDTAAVVAARAARFPRIHYCAQGYRGGIDRDIAAAVRLSHGEYCWLFSADDIMRPGAIARVLAATATNHDVYLCEHTLTSATLEPIGEHPPFQGIAPGTVFQLGDPRERRRYFEHARTSEAFFSYLAGPIFRRSVWDAADGIPESFYGTCWGIAGRLLSRIQTGLTVEYLGASLILKRSGVDSFVERGIVHRMSITVDGFAHIADTLFGRKSPETFHIRRVTRNEAAFAFRRLVSVKLIVADRDDPATMQDYLALLGRHFADAGVTGTIRRLLLTWLPVRPFRWMRGLKNRLRGEVGEY